MRVQISQGEGAILGVVRAIQKHWEPSLQRHGRVRCNRDHSIANNVIHNGISQYARQA